ncbi:hypothetical protein [Tropicimonas sp. S265A]|uniref:hypothetical protein n=1 Tax=Tropicimonas sp. S265A TaxID=3415134 RepID=UPI003C7BFB28
MHPPPKKSLARVWLCLLGVFLLSLAYPLETTAFVAENPRDLFRLEAWQAHFAKLDEFYGNPEAVDALAATIVIQKLIAILGLSWLMVFLMQAMRFKHGPHGSLVRDGSFGFKLVPLLQVVAATILFVPISFDPTNDGSRLHGMPIAIFQFAYASTTSCFASFSAGCLLDPRYVQGAFPGMFKQKPQ